MYVKITLRILSTDRSKIDRGTASKLVLSHNTENVFLSLNNTYNLTFGCRGLNRLSPCVHLWFSPFNDEAGEITTTVIIRIGPIQHHQLSGNHDRL